MKLSVRWIVIAVFFISSLLLLPDSAFADNQTLNDLSWPNCNEKITSLSSSGIVGINDGLDFSHNPCLAQESLLFHSNYSLYLNTGYPGKSYGLMFKNSPKHCSSNNLNCLAYNFGYNDAVHSLMYAWSQNSHSFSWWLDVETENSWTNSYKQNREALIGMINAIHKYTFMPTIGIYSSSGQWQTVTKGWINLLPAWAATGSNSKQAATNYCSSSFNGGPTWLTQYTKYLDMNYNCLDLNVNTLR
jgi:hypothetical protein